MPIPYYYNSPLAAMEKIPLKQGHKLGHIPKYLREAREKEVRSKA